MMKRFESNWQNKEGLNFYIQGWEPEQKPKAVIALIHGLGEHTGRYTHVGEAFNNAGYTLVGFDLRGHGKSDGARGHFPSIDAVMQDINEFFGLVRGRYPKDTLFFIYGHSLGGLLTLTFVLKKQPDVKGVVVTAPGLRSALQEQKFKVMLANVLGTIAPTITLASGLDPQTLSHDQKVVDAYVNDPLVHDKTSTGLGKSALSAIDFAFANASKFSAPLLVMVGSEDKLTYPSGGQDFIKIVPGDVTFKLWDGMYHEIHNEPGKAEVLNYAIQWMNDHLKNK
jgi:alpha-beta hydrolase superfamily lysophospholipase